VTSIMCTGKTTKLFKFLEKSNVLFRKLNSMNTSIFRNGLTIKIRQKVDESNVMSEANKLANTNQFDVMISRGEPSKVKYLKLPMQQSDARLDVQIKMQLRNHLENELKLGYFNAEQKDCLDKNVGVVVSTLCMLEKHWHKFMNKEFPNVPIKQTKLKKGKKIL